MARLLGIASERLAGYDLALPAYRGEFKPVNAKYRKG